MALSNNRDHAPKSLIITRFWLDSSHDVSQNDPTRLESQSMTRHSSQSDFYKISSSNGQSHFVCIQRDEHFLPQWWSRLIQIFCFDSAVVLCYTSRINQVFPTCKEVDLRICFLLMGHQGTIYRHLTIVQCAVVCAYHHGSRAHAVTLAFGSFPDRSKVI